MRDSEIAQEFPSAEAWEHFGGGRHRARILLDPWTEKRCWLLVVEHEYQYVAEQVSDLSTTPINTSETELWEYLFQRLEQLIRHGTTPGTDPAPSVPRHSTCRPGAGGGSAP